MTVKKMKMSGAVALVGVLTAAAQSAFVYQYNGMNETNRVAVKSVKVSGANRTLTWTADRDYPQCGVGFERDQLDHEELRLRAGGDLRRQPLRHLVRPLRAVHHRLGNAA